eukprot:gene7615-10369_t
MSTVLHIMPYFSFKWIQRQYLEEVSSIIDNEINVNNKTLKVIHSFSNNGCLAYASLCRNHFFPIDNNGQSRNNYNYKLIIDSAPFFRYDETEFLQQTQEIFLLSKGISLALKIPPIIGPIIRPIISGFIIASLLGKKIIEYENRFIKNIIQLIAPNLFDNTSEETMFVLGRYMKDYSPKVPLLFIYSEGDMLIPVKEVEGFILLMKKRKFSIEELQFGNDVPHVAGMSKKPKEYFEKVDQFLNR